MGSLGLAGKRRLLLPVLAICAPVVGVLVALASAAGPGGWDHLGDHGTAGSDSLNLVANALEVTPGGSTSAASSPTPAGSSTPTASRSGTAAAGARSARRRSRSPTVSVFAIAVAGGKVYAGGVFTNAGSSGTPTTSRSGTARAGEPFCTEAGTETIGNVRALQIVGPTLYVGGETSRTARASRRPTTCSRATWPPACSSATIVDPTHPFSGPVKALTATSDGHALRGRKVQQPREHPAADNVAYLDGGGGTDGLWRRRPRLVRLRVWTLTFAGWPPVGTNVFVGTEGSTSTASPRPTTSRSGTGRRGARVAPEAAARTDGSRRRPTSTTSTSRRHARLRDRNVPERERRRPRRQHRLLRRQRLAPGRIQRRRQRPVGRRRLRPRDRRPQLYAAGNFTSAGGDTQAQSVASFSLTQIIAYPTPTVTAGPSAQPTPTVTPSPTAPDVTPPATSVRGTRINQAARKATFKFASGEPGSTFSCKLDKKQRRSCTSPKTYKKLAPGKHVFRVTARDRAGNLDGTPAVRRFKIKRR